MRIRFVLFWTLLTGTMMLGAGVALAQSYPNRLIRIGTSEPGGTGDFSARLIAQGLTRNLGQQVIVENRGGAGGAIVAEYVAKAPPDGYTLLFYSSGFWTLPFVQAVAYDPLRDFSPVVLTTRAPNVLVVHPSLPVKSVTQLIALAKAKPGELAYAAGGAGAPAHLAAELFKVMAGVQFVHVPYKGTGPAIIDLLGGHVQLMFSPAVLVTTHIKSGRLRALAVTSAEPSPLVPGLPTVSASGLPGYESMSFYGIWAPAGTPAAIVSQLNQETVRVLNRPDVKEKFLNVGAEVVGSSPDQFAAIIKSDTANVSKVIKHVGLRNQ